MSEMLCASGAPRVLGCVLQAMHLCFVFRSHQTSSLEGGGGLLVAKSARFLSAELLPELLQDHQGGPTPFSVGCSLLPGVLVALHSPGENREWGTPVAWVQWCPWLRRAGSPFGGFLGLFLPCLC